MSMYIIFWLTQISECDRSQLSRLLWLTWLIFLASKARDAISPIHIPCFESAEGKSSSIELPMNLFKKKEERGRCWKDNPKNTWLWLVHSSTLINLHEWMWLITSCFFSWGSWLRGRWAPSGQFHCVGWMKRTGHRARSSGWTALVQLDHSHNGSHFSWQKSNRRENSL